MEEIMDNINEYKINDFYQAVVLKTLGFPLLRLEGSNGRFFTFVFSDSGSKAKEVISKYWNGEVTVNAKVLIDTINELKTRIHTGI